MIRFPLATHPPTPLFFLLTSPRLSICGKDLHYDGDDDEKRVSIRGTGNCVYTTFVDGLPMTKKRRRDSWRKESTVKRKIDLEHSCCR